MKNKQFLELPNIYAIIHELRTPLLELQSATKSGDCKAGHLIAQQTVKLFDSLLYAQRLDAVSKQDLIHNPYSLVAVTEESLQRLSKFAQLHHVQLQLEFDYAHKHSVGLIKSAFDHATDSLLHGIISACQSVNRSVVKISINHRSRPTLRVFSPALNLDQPHSIQRLHSRRTKTDMQLHNRGGLLLARYIYHQIGSAMSFTANQHGQGLKINFKTIHQLSLMGV